MTKKRQNKKPQKRLQDIKAYEYDSKTGTIKEASKDSEAQQILDFIGGIINDKYRYKYRLFRVLKKG